MNYLPTNQLPFNPSTQYNPPRCNPQLPNLVQHTSVLCNNIAQSFTSHSDPSLVATVHDIPRSSCAPSKIPSNITQHVRLDNHKRKQDPTTQDRRKIRKLDNVYIPNSIDISDSECTEEEGRRNDIEESVKEDREIYREANGRVSERGDGEAGGGENEDVNWVVGGEEEVEDNEEGNGEEYEEEKKNESEESVKEDREIYREANGRVSERGDGEAGGGENEDVNWVVGGEEENRDTEDHKREADYYDENEEEVEDNEEGNGEEYEEGKIEYLLSNAGPTHNQHTPSTPNPSIPSSYSFHSPSTSSPTPPLSTREDEVDELASVISPRGRHGVRAGEPSAFQVGSDLKEIMNTILLNADQQADVLKQVVYSYLINTSM